MLRSMTGFGAARDEGSDRIVSVEVRSVNHRYLDVRAHLPGELSRLAAPIEAAVKKRLSRGRIDVAVQLGRAGGGEGALTVDVEKAKALRDAYRQIAEALSLKDEVSLEAIAAAPGVVIARDIIADVEFADLEHALAGALDRLGEMREAEGRALEMELREHLDRIAGLVERIETLVPMTTTERREKLERRLQDLVGDAEIDPMRLAQEVAILADRSDVTEELQRLASHCSQFEEMLAGRDPIGRRLDFLIQEMNREANTIGSKCSHTEIAYVVVDIKAELERMREQIQNVE